MVFVICFVNDVVWVFVEMFGGLVLNFGKMMMVKVCLFGMCNMIYVNLNGLFDDC